MTPKEVNAEIKKLGQKLKYQEKKISSKDEMSDETLQKLREISRPLAILDMIQAIDNSIINAKLLRATYLTFYQIGTPEDFYIQRISETNENENLSLNLNEYDRAYTEILLAIKEAHENFRTSLNDIKLDDFFQKMIDNR